jgi:hypothetical protein
MLFTRKRYRLTNHAGCRRVRHFVLDVEQVVVSWNPFISSFQKRFYLIDVIAKKNKKWFKVLLML